ncbi:MAG: 4Fe-4S binding protein, partial [Clostridia bacterium]|nr:4Fe-4S binding protein [Clostridia bacterium]
MPESSSMPVQPPSRARFAARESSVPAKASRMIGPVLTSIWRGRFWCGHVCPRGSMYDRLLS